ncbi:MAG: tRNA pseudouridine(38-40) synthase TruA [Bacteriovoracaceae bacterium]
MKFHYIATLSYDGTNYQGWQIQDGELKTIQGILNNVLTEICKGNNNLKTIGASRTDKGVHALDQKVKISIPLYIDPEGLRRGLNALLPKDIRALNIIESTEDFHPLRKVYQKEYIYLFSNRAHFGNHTPFQLKKIANFPYKFNIDAMRSVCDLYVGEYDFKNFYCLGSGVKTTRRTIISCSLTEESPSGVLKELLPSYYIFKIRGNGFLKQMVRIMVGTMWNVGRGKISLDTVRDALECKTTGKLSPVAPASGLYLSRVDPVSN